MPLAGTWANAVAAEKEFDLVLRGFRAVRTVHGVFIDGAGDDARFLSAHLASYLDNQGSAR